MKEDLYFPLELWREILRRLPLKSIMRCKCVCKSWRGLIQGEWGEFATSYTPKPGLAFAHSTGYAICDEAFQPLFQFHLPPPHDQYSSYDYPRAVIGSVICDEAFQPLFQFHLPPPHDQYSSYDYPRAVIGSVNGLILVRERFDNSHITLFVLNPITGEYIELPSQPARRSVFGFGVSRLSGQYKIFCGNLSRSCYVYTLGGREGLWRSIPAATALPNLEESAWNATTGPSLDHAVFFNGNLHWLASDFEDKKNIFLCCFDLETEQFTRFSLPDGHEYDSTIYGIYQLCILDSHLCFCNLAANCYDNPTNLLNVIWSMKSYGDPKSWLVEYTFYSPIPRHCLNADDEITFDIVFPIKVSNGDLVFCIRDQLFICSNENVTAYGFLPYGHLYNLSKDNVYTPSFLSFKTIGIHDVQLLN